MTAELVATGSAGIQTISPALREVAVTRYLTDARDRLALAVEATGPEAVAALKAEIATVAEATKQLGLSKEIRDDATEMVRRAEYAVEKSIRKGQAEGIVKSLGDGGGTPTPGMRGSSPRSAAERDDRPSPRDFFNSGQERSEVYQLGNASPEQLDIAIEGARAEGNLSRANVVRKVKGESAKLTGDNRIAKIADLALKGWASSQIGRELGHTEEYIRQLARDNMIDIPADKALRGSRRGVDHNRIVQETVSALDGLCVGVRLCDLNEVDYSQSDEWVTSLNNSLRSLNRWLKQIQEITHV